MPEESRLRKGLGKDVSNLIFCCNGMHRDLFADIGAEEVIPLVNVFSSGPVLGIVSNLHSTAIVLKDSTMDLCSCSMHFISKLFHFF